MFITAICVLFLVKLRWPKNKSLYDIINHYFSLGLAYSEILAFLLCFHGIEISLRQLKRVLRRQGLRRRKDQSGNREILNAIEDELEGSGNSIVVSSTKRTCVTADHVRPDKFPIYRAIIFHISRDNFHLSRDKEKFIARNFSSIAR